MSDLRSDIVEEALRVAGEADREGLSLRLLGGVAIKLRAKDGLHPAFEREYADLDWITPKGTSAEVQRFSKALGYEPHVRFNSMYGQERLLFFDREHDRQVDVLVGTFRMSHEIRFGKRLDVEPLTIPLAELLLTKLQIVELNEKDIRDALALLHDHPVEDADGDSVNAKHIAQLCAADWGLWRTFTANLEALGGHVGRYDLQKDEKRRIADRIRVLQERIEQEPKSFGWKMRSKIGDRKRWYELPKKSQEVPDDRRNTMISRLFSRNPQVRVFFATDIHGSETCWRKFLNAAKHYEADVMVLGGDITGKALVPIVEEGSGRWRAALLENRYDFESEAEVKEFEDAVRRRGYHPFRTDPGKMSELESDEELRDELFYKEMLGTVERWMRMADEKLEGTDIECFVSPGNDDQFEVDEIVSEAKRVQLAEGRVVEFGDFQMVSTGWSNRTPWDTYREEPEDKLLERLQKMIDQVTAPPEKTIYNFHCPPYGTGLDDAPELTEDLRPKHGGRSIVPVGSKAVKEAIEKGQPALSLHRHIHEARGTTRIGRTLAINPGSSYEQGQLLGAIIDLDGKQKVKRFILTSG